jgi:hypothetical protein
MEKKMDETAWYHYALVYSFESTTGHGSGRCFVKRSAPLDTADEMVLAEESMLKECGSGANITKLFITNIIQLRDATPTL